MENWTSGPQASDLRIQASDLRMLLNAEWLTSERRTSELSLIIARVRWIQIKADVRGDKKWTEPFPLPW